MDNAATCSLVNGLLIEVHRSLLQYTAEASPWSAGEDQLTCQRVIDMATDQSVTVHEMVDFLVSRNSRVSFGTYPQEYTSLHFVSFGYLLNRLKESEAALITELESGKTELAADLEAATLIDSAIQREKDILAALQEIEVSAEKSTIVD